MTPIHTFLISRAYKNLNTKNHTLCYKAQVPGTRQTALINPNWSDDPSMLIFVHYYPK